MGQTRMVDGIREIALLAKIGLSLFCNNGFCNLFAGFFIELQ
jgi:hypothetical protein